MMKKINTNKANLCEIIVCKDLDLLQTARPAFLTENDEIIKIIHEEVQAYYSGQKSADDVAKVIQNRVSLYVSENT